MLSFYLDLKNLTREPSATLGNLDKDIGVQEMGIAVFSHDKLIGELTKEESIYYLILNNALKSCTIQVPNPNNSNKTIDLLVTLKNKTKSKIDIVNGSPYITSNISIDANILSMDEQSRQYNIQELQEHVSNYLQSEIQKFCYRTSKEFGVDIIGFGEYEVKNYLFYDDWKNSNWLANYKNVSFGIKVKTIVKPSYLLN